MSAIAVPPWGTSGRARPGPRKDPTLPASAYSPRGAAEWVLVSCSRTFFSAPETQRRTRVGEMAPQQSDQNKVGIKPRPGTPCAPAGRRREPAVPNELVNTASVSPPAGTIDPAP